MTKDVEACAAEPNKEKKSPSFSKNKKEKKKIAAGVFKNSNRE